MTLALPALLARLAGRYPLNPGLELAALAPLAVVPAVAAMIIAAYAAWWLVTGGYACDPGRAAGDVATASAQVGSFPGCARAIARNRICCGNAQAAPVHGERQGRHGRPGRAPSPSAGARRGCASDCP